MWQYLQLVWLSVWRRIKAAGRPSEGRFFPFVLQYDIIVIRLQQSNKHSLQPNDGGQTSVPPAFCRRSFQWRWLNKQSVCRSVYKSGSWKGFLIIPVNRHPFPLTSPYAWILSSVSSFPQCGSFLLVLNTDTEFIPPILSSRPNEELVSHAHTHVCAHSHPHLHPHPHTHSHVHTHKVTSSLLYITL